MRVEEISSFDSSFKLESSDKEVGQQTLRGICDGRELKKGHLYFCSSNRFWNLFLESTEKRVFLIFDTKTLESVVDDPALTSSMGWGTVKSAPLSMSFLSKPFHDIVHADYNDAVDGRKTGSASIHSSAVIAENVFIGANVVIEEGVTILANTVILSNSRIGKDTFLYPNVSIMQNCKIGKYCRVHSGATIGSDGFGYNFDQGIHHKVWHVGGVVIGDNVEVGSNTSIDQGTFSPTIIGSGTKLDNLVQIGHNVILKQGVVLCGQAGLAGSITVGDYTVMGGQAAVAPDLTIGSGCQIGGKAGVISSLKDSEVVGGFPARPIKEWFKGVAYLRKNSLKK
jgi:UDP-3-O-[3-hydroxymyristoyl] glucosamine N-acyltransferase